MRMRSTVIAALLAAGLADRLEPSNWKPQRPPKVTHVQRPVDFARPEQGSREKQRRLRQLKKKEQKA